MAVAAAGARGAHRLSGTRAGQADRLRRALHRARRAPVRRRRDGMDRRGVGSGICRRGEEGRQRCRGRRRRRRGSHRQIEGAADHDATARDADYDDVATCVEDRPVHRSAVSGAGGRGARHWSHVVPAEIRTVRFGSYVPFVRIAAAPGAGIAGGGGASWRRMFAARSARRASICPPPIIAVPRPTLGERRKADVQRPLVLRPVLLGAADPRRAEAGRRSSGLQGQDRRRQRHGLGHLRGAGDTICARDHRRRGPRQRHRQSAARARDHEAHLALWRRARRSAPRWRSACSAASRACGRSARGGRRCRTDRVGQRAGLCRRHVDAAGHAARRGRPRRLSGSSPGSTSSKGARSGR